MSEPYPLGVVYCTDEDLAIRCPTDITVLTPPSSVVAVGSDGVVDVGDPWTLHTGSVDFVAQQIAPGGLVHLSGGSIRGSGYHLVVDTVAAGSLTLRRIGRLAGVGQPPGSPEGLTSVRFSISTLAPQIEQVSDELNRRFGIDPRTALRGPTAMYDRRELQEAAMLMVLLRQYTVSTRTGEGDFAFKVRELKENLDATLARIAVRWGSTGADGPASGVFGMRLERG